LFLHFIAKYKATSSANPAINPPTMEIASLVVSASTKDRILDNHRKTKQGK